ncbi:MAG: hypothetical protein HYU66_06380, partial [Armatimonadetes bacterium]|nr:hypothetical protein [Armatimonadota bacterium]
PGLIRNSALVQDIRSVECVRTNWWEGWGIHGTRRGWLYNVSGFDAVLITLEQGKSFMLGTDEPEVLAEALRRTMAGGSA